MPKDALTDKEWNALVERLALRLWHKRHKGLIDPATTRAHAQKLMEAVQKGLGYGYADDLSPQQAHTLTQLQRNVYHFSGAKNWHQLREMSALLSAQNKPRSFNEFLKAVRLIDATYNQTYLRAEYNHAIASAQMTAKWQQLEAEAHTLPYLQYVAVMDARTREEHRILHHIVRHISDPFWRTWYPPNGWNCRCSVLQLDEHEAAGRHTQPLPADLPPLHPMFRNNVGINPIIYSPRHPYFASIPEPLVSRVLAASQELQLFKPERLNVLLLERDKQFSFNTFGKTGRLLIHKLVDVDARDYQDLLNIGLQKAKSGKVVEILPTLKTHELPYFYQKIFPDFNKKPKQPDLRIGVDYAEVERSVDGTANSIDQRVRRGAKQASHVILLTPHKLKWKEIVRIAVKRAKREGLDSIEIISPVKKYVIYLNKKPKP